MDFLMSRCYALFLYAFALFALFALAYLGYQAFTGELRVGFKDVALSPILVIGVVMMIRDARGRLRGDGAKQRNSEGQW